MEQAIMENVPMERPTALSIIESVDLNKMNRQVQAISDFQNLVQSQFQQDHDFGVIPGTKKPTMLKPGAEKLIMLMGMTSEFFVVDQTRDFENGFFQYQIKCVLKSGGVTITEGLGSCNTKERKYLRQDPYTMDNTVLKMAKKRALIDAALMVGALSDVFTQDIEDMDLNGRSFKQEKPRVYTDRDGVITKKQADEVFAIAGGDAELVQDVMKDFGYKSSKEIQKTDYARFLQAVTEKVRAKNATSETFEAKPEEPPVEDLPEFLKDEE